MIRPGICTKCGEDFLNCKCEQFHPNILDVDTVVKDMERAIKEPAPWVSIAMVKTWIRLLKHG